ncbi:hypothetical protein OG21DRAFT_1606461 [Imleria badia]|nr:hypothetical protein OG21DRAFT_1606461 [Imleria badia]
MALLVVAGDNWASERKESRVVEFVGDYALGLCAGFKSDDMLAYGPILAGYREYVHGASWGRVVSQGYATYCYPDWLDNVRTRPSTQVIHKVHAMFGYTLVLAGLAQIIDVCFIPTSSSAGSLDDNESEHTLTSGINTYGESRSKVKAALARGVEGSLALTVLWAEKPSGAFAQTFIPVVYICTTDEELDAVHDVGWSMSRVSSFPPFCRLTVCSLPLPRQSLAFLLYLFTLFPINLYATSAREADTSTHAPDVVFSAPPNGEIELTSPRDASKWYAPVPREEGPVHVLGEDEE